MRAPADPVVFLLDVDNTLLDNDAVIADMREFVRGTLGAEHERRYWAVFEHCRAELGYADYLGALQRFREQAPEACRLVDVSLFFLPGTRG
jgi:FMN phosphatase YigB (HAD superfamily)